MPDVLTDGAAPDAAARRAAREREAEARAARGAGWQVSFETAVRAVGAAGPKPVRWPWEESPAP